MSFFEKYITAYGSAIQKGYKSNAFSPLIWFNVFVLPFLFATIYWSKNEVIGYIAAGLIALVLIFSFVMYLMLFKKDPKLLQSESFRIENRRMDIIEEKGSKFRIKDVDLVPPTNYLSEEGNNNG